MPELPDVEIFRRRFARGSLHKPVARVHVRDASLIEGTSGRSLSRRLKGDTFERTRRHGKHMAAETSEHGWLILHFGMTGYVQPMRNGDTEEPDHTALLIDFEDDSRLAYINKRRLGKIRLVDDFDEFIDAEDLGPDAMDLSLKGFREIVDGRSGAIKALLMNQNALAGVGNVYADEALFHAGVRPSRKSSDLSDDEVKTIHRNLRHVLKGAIKHGARPDDMPRSWLLPRREKGAECPRCGGSIRKTTVGGRATYWCGEHQT